MLWWSYLSAAALLLFNSVYADGCSEFDRPNVTVRSVIAGRTLLFIFHHLHHDFTHGRLFQAFPTNDLSTETGTPRIQPIWMISYRHMSPMVDFEPY
jgi:hypothetical protein